jgi:signal transduction histidine kinase
VRKGGERFWASGVTTSIRDPAGALRGYVKVCRDLTERRHWEERQQQLLEQEKLARWAAEKAMSVRDEFLAVVSHELRTPLTAVLLWARLLRTGAVKEQERDLALETIEQSAQAQRQLIEDLLDISRITSGKMRLNVRDVDPAAVVQAAVEAVRPMAEAKGVRIETSLPPGAGTVRADPDRLQQVVWNLLNNAAKFTGRGGRIVVDAGICPRRRCACAWRTRARGSPRRSSRKSSTSSARPTPG